MVAVDAGASPTGRRARRRSGTFPAPVAYLARTLQPERVMPALDVLLFASYADAFGAPTVRVELPAGATVADLVASLRTLPAGSILPERPLVAVDRAYAAPGDPVLDRGEVALIPPVAGG